jgi:transcriptional regulator with XRE-family HTH domain
VAEPGLGPQLRTLRTAAGRTVASVAQDAGLSVPYIANLENGRGNPTLTALRRLASALGARLVVSLVPASRPALPDAAAEVPASLVRVRRTAAFRRRTEEMAGQLSQDHQDFSARLTGALATLAATLDIEPSETDWWRLLDALLLLTAHPEPDRSRR